MSEYSDSISEEYLSEHDSDREFIEQDDDYKPSEDEFTLVEEESSESFIEEPSDWE
jgi:hypothetical protein